MPPPGSLELVVRKASWRRWARAARPGRKWKAGVSGLSLACEGTKGEIA